MRPILTHAIVAAVALTAGVGGHALVSPGAKPHAPSPPAVLAIDPHTLYPVVPLATIADGKWLRPRAKVTGTVELVRHEDDNDIHIRISDGGKWIVCEFIPEVKLPPQGMPKVGDRITIWGIVREDAYHPQGIWRELHPAINWQSAP